MFSGVKVKIIKNDKRVLTVILSVNNLINNSKSKPNDYLTLGLIPQSIFAPDLNNTK